MSDPTRSPRLPNGSGASDRQDALASRSQALDGSTASIFQERRSWLGTVGYFSLSLICLGVIVWSFSGVGLQLPGMASQAKNAASTVREFFPPDRSILKQEWIATLTTIQMAVVGTLLGAVAAFPVSFFAARTTSLLWLLAMLIKTLMNIVRAIPLLIYAVILTAMVGLGPQTGALAIAVGSFVMLVKLYAEALESIASGPVEAVRAAGGNTAQVFVYGMLPQVFPNFVATTLYAFELNVQASFILGFVGAGGVGFDLLNYSRMMQWRSVCTVLLITIVVVNVIDLISYRIRATLSSRVKEVRLEK